MMLQEAKKKSSDRRTVAVDSLCLGIPRGQCFGFLGINGAGKTTTLKMVTGDIDATSGNAYVMGMDCVDQETEARKHMGYCPQFDPLFDLMTGNEHLRMYARIRGVEKSAIEARVSGILDTVGLTMYADVPAGTYSGGNKRKLSLALALVGEPSVVFLDEPSSGMDPVSRRFMWDVIKKVAKRCCVILTTHSMEECEALCSRIGIMVDGRLRCLGSSQHLKQRFGKGYKLEAKMNPKRMKSFQAFMTKNFPTAVIVEVLSNGIVRYEMERGKANLANIFKVIEAAKAGLGVTEWSVSQSSLEQVFIQIAQEGESEENKHQLVPEDSINQQSIFEAKESKYSKNMLDHMPRDMSEYSLDSRGRSIDGLALERKGSVFDDDVDKPVVVASV